MIKLSSSGAPCLLWARPPLDTMGPSSAQGGRFHVLFQRKLRGVRPSPKAGGRGAQVRLHRGHGPCRPDGGLLPFAGWADARKAHPHLREGPHPRRGLRRLGIPGAGLCDARRPGDGQPLRGDVGPVPLHPLHRIPGPKRPGRVLLPEQARPQLFPDAGHGGSGPRRPHRRKVRPERQGRPGDPAPVLHPGRGALRPPHHGLLQRRGAEFEFLALLAHHVRL